VGQDGSFYINGNNSIRKIDPQGIIQTIAGTGNFGAVKFQFPLGSLAIDADMEGAGIPAALPNGDFYVACCESNVDKVSAADGTIQVFVRGYDFTGFAVFGGDGGPAIDGITNNGVDSLSVDSIGNVYIVDVENNRVRKVWINGLPSSTPTATPSP
jgi:hypothetical protein